MRMANDSDNAILRSAVSDAAANLLEFVPSLGTGEAFVFGEGVALPTRLRFAELPAHVRPFNEAMTNLRMAHGAVDLEFIASVIDRWRGTVSSRSRTETPPPEAQPEVQPALPPARSGGGITAERFSILKKPILVR